jgi:hypothetical protein
MRRIEIHSAGMEGIFLPIKVTAFRVPEHSRYAQDVWIYLLLCTHSPDSEIDKNTFIRKKKVKRYNMVTMR